jgi:hypothetical protein
MATKLLCLFVSALVLSTSAACNRCSPDVTARGAASVAWSISIADQPASCAAVGATSVTLLLHPRAGADVTTAFACTDGQGTTPAVVAGPYEATVTLRAADGAVIATAPTQASVTIGADQVTTLSPAAFSVDDHGKLVVSLATLGTRSNCADGTHGGAGVTANFLTLEHSFGSCAPVTFTRARGATQLGTYTVDCGTPVTSGCIERDETLTVDDLPSGGYVIRVTGMVGAIRCWNQTDVFEVAGGGATTTRTVQLATFGAGC